MRTIFREFDKDRSGALDKKEFRKGLQTLGCHLNDRDFTRLMKQVRDGHATYS